MYIIKYIHIVLYIFYCIIYMHITEYVCLLSIYFNNTNFNFRAKSKNGGRMLREKLEKIGMTLPAGSLLNPLQFSVLHRQTDRYTNTQTNTCAHNQINKHTHTHTNAHTLGAYPRVEHLKGASLR
jgi:hypothetical protein